MTTSVHTVSDLLLAIADAMAERDEERLMALRRRAETWLQPEHEFQAQAAVIEAAVELIGELGE